MHRSKTAEDFFKSLKTEHKFKSAGLSAKYCEKHGTQLCTIELLNWADVVFTMEPMHRDRIEAYAGKDYLHKIHCLDIEDVYQHMQNSLVELLAEHHMLKFLQKVELRQD